MTSANLVDCDAVGCKDGLVLHVKRKIGSGASMVDDPADRQIHDLCPKCGGSGKIPYAPPKNLEEKARGLIADQTEFG